MHGLPLLYRWPSIKQAGQMFFVFHLSPSCMSLPEQKKTGIYYTQKMINFCNLAKQKGSLKFSHTHENVFSGFDLNWTKEVLVPLKRVWGLNSWHTICQASGILLMCCPWVSVIIGWITDATAGKKHLQQCAFLKSSFGFGILSLNERTSWLSEAPSNKDTCFILNILFEHDGRTHFYIMLSIHSLVNIQFKQTWKWCTVIFFSPNINPGLLFAVLDSKGPGTSRYRHASRSIQSFYSQKWHHWELVHVITFLLL